ncbi:MAG: hypothetical protein RLZZ297_151, partial [Chloroflexota bacterium]
MSPKNVHVALPPLILPNGPRTEERAVRHTFGQERDAIDVPNLIETQIASFNWFRTDGLKELFKEISPIADFTTKNLELRFGEFAFGQPRHDEHECREYDLTYSAPLRVSVQLRILSTGEIKESDTFLGDFPLMTENGTFVINGAERVVVSQLIRSPGVYFSAERDPNTGRDLHSAKLIPNRGAWLEFETNRRDVVSVKVDRKRKIPVSVLLRAVLAWVASENGEGHWCDDSELTQRGLNEHVEALFGSLEDKYEHKYLRTTLDKDNTHNAKEALIELYKRLRPGDPPTLDNAKSLLESYFFSERRYDLAKVGRYKLNKNLYERDGTIDPPSIDVRVLLVRDIIKIVERLILLNNGAPGMKADDIDHLGNRRVRTVGELIQQQFRVGLLRMERVIKERMSLVEADTATPNSLINIRPVLAAIREWFGGSQLSQFMDQTNPLAELTNKRRLSALGPGGLSRDRAGFEVRDVHHSHYGRICPVETPEGPNIGLIGTMSTFARVNEMGFLETPYRRVYREIQTAQGIYLEAKETTRTKGKVIAQRDYRDIITGDLLLVQGSVLTNPAETTITATISASAHEYPYKDLADVLPRIADAISTGSANGVQYRGQYIIAARTSQAKDEAEVAERFADVTKLLKDIHASDSGIAVMLTAFEAAANKRGLENPLDLTQFSLGKHKAGVKLTVGEIARALAAFSTSAPEYPYKELADVLPRSVDAISTGSANGVQYRGQYIIAARTSQAKDEAEVAERFAD